MKRIISAALMVTLFTTLVSGQNLAKTEKPVVNEGTKSNKFSVSTTWLIFANTESEETNVHMYEFHFGYKVTPKDKIEIKIAGWKSFEPFGIPLWDPLLRKESEWYPGKIKERGIGFTYQRFLWKGLFAQIEVLPLWKTYLDENKKRIEDGFKLYTSYHLGYHIPLLKDRLYLEPQIHCNYWPVDTKGPQGFEEKENKWNNYFLFEPNLFIGVNF